MYMRRILPGLLITVALGLSARAAMAQKPIPLTMVDLSSDSYAGVRLGYRTLELLMSDFDVVNLEVFAEAKVAERVKLFAVLPAAHMQEQDGDQDSFTALGNVTGGLRLVGSTPRQDGGSDRVGLSASISLPTTPDLDEDDVVAPTLGAIANVVHDLGLYLPQTTTVRILGSTCLEGSVGFFQAEGGLDYHFFDKPETKNPFDDEDNQDALIGRFSVGAGFYMTNQLSALGEIVTVGLIDEFDEDMTDTSGDDYLHSLEVGVRYDAPAVGVAGRLSIPLDESRSDQLSPSVTIEWVGRF